MNRGGIGNEIERWRAGSTAVGRTESGRPDSNRRRPAWEAGILPLNYAREFTEVKTEAAEGEVRYFEAEASRKLRRSGSLIAGSPGDTLSKRPCFIHRSSSPTRSNR